MALTLSALPPAGSIKLRYGLDHLAAGLNIATGASGNLRDSSPDSAVIDGSDVALPHVCPHFELTVYTLGE
nr:hypothetical protein [uncultured Shimia sp.]